MVFELMVFERLNWLVKSYGAIGENARMFCAGATLGLGIKN